VSDQPHPNPAVTGLNATLPQLHARAAADYTAAQTAARQHAAQGGPGQRDGILHGESNR
jgi:hypothetical protein